MTISINPSTTGWSERLKLTDEPHDGVDQVAWGAGEMPVDAQVRGFAIYVGMGEDTASAAGRTLAEVASGLRAELSRLAPTAQAYAVLALAPTGSGGSDLNMVRLALHEPAATAANRDRAAAETPPETGVLIDISRNRVTVDGTLAPLTFTEFELLQTLVRRHGLTVSRHELITRLSQGAGSASIAQDRTIDVHVRRLRLKLGPYGYIVRTVRGGGYRFDRHRDVVVRQSSTPSPDVF